MPDIQGHSSEARLLTDERFLRKVAYLYFEDGNSQETIAAMESCSRQAVSKALQKAKERGIVRISITPDLRAGYLRNLSREVRTQLGLEDLVLVPGSNMNTLAARDVVEDAIAEIANAAADYLDQMFTDSDIVAVSGGRRFMRNLVRHLNPTKTLSHMQVVATIGFVEGYTTSGDANSIARDLADAYGASHLWFPCPALLPDSAQLRLVRQLPIIKEAYDMMTRANVVVMGLWTPHTNQELVRRGILSEEQLAVIETYEPTVDINHWVFDASGKCINELVEHFPYYLSGLEIPRLKDRIEQGNTKVILIAGGSPSYVPPIQATLNAGLANILITDHITAQLLLNN